MKFLSKVEWTKWILMTAVMFIMTALCSTEVFANNAQFGELSGFVTTGMPKKIIDFGFAGYCLWLWFKFFMDFQPAGFLKDIIVPALMTVLAFNWVQILNALFA